MSCHRTCTAVILFGGLFVARGASADDFAGDSMEIPTTGLVNPAASRSWSEPGMKSGIGVGVALGGGIGGFTDQTMRDATASSVGGLWNLRVAIGTHIPLAFELAYAGSAVNLRSLGQDNGTLVGTSLVAGVRYNILPHANFNPYVFAGAGYQRYDVRDAQLAQSDSGIVGQDEIAVFPVGAGLSYRDRSGLTADLRGTYRATTESDLVLDMATNNPAELDSWEASASLGYEF